MPANSQDRVFRNQAAISRIPQKEVSDFLDSQARNSTVERLIAEAYDFFCREGNHIARGPKLAERVTFVNHVAMKLLPGFRLTESALIDLRTVLEGGSIDQIELWVKANR